MFSGNQSEEPNGLMSELQKLQSNTSPKELNENQILESLQAMAKTYGNYVFHDIYIAIQVKELNSNQFFIYSHSKGLEKLNL